MQFFGSFLVLFYSGILLRKNYRANAKGIVGRKTDPQWMVVALRRIMLWFLSAISQNDGSDAVGK